jgi:alpha-galactosidase
MKILISLALFAGSCLAADVTGNWMVSQQTADGNVRKTYFDLKQDGEKITGFIHDSRSDRKIQEGSIDAAGNIKLVTAPPNGGAGIPGGPGRPGAPGGRGAPQPTTAKLSADGLHVMMRVGRGEPETDLVAVKRPAGEGGAPARIEPPALHKIPYNGLAKTPPMGWNSWNKFAGRVTDADVRATADAIVSSGLKDAGYEYVNIDDTWEAGRDAQGNIQTNKKFPDMKALADYVHSKGLKIGIYSSPGPSTCAGYEGSYGHEEQDAKTYAAWGIDYLKYDWCGASRVYKDEDMQAVYQKMGDSLAKSGRKIVYSLCQYGRADVWKWGPEVGGNLWRTTGDIRDTWESMDHIGFDQQEKIPEFAGPGHWNDPDMLEIGNGHMSDEEYRVHMSLWSMLAAPLLAGNDLNEMTPQIKSILTNKEVIGVDQDKKGAEAKRIAKVGNTEIWTRPLADGSQAVALFNRGGDSANMTVKWSDLGDSGLPKKVRDLWAHSDIKATGAEYSAIVPSHGVVMLKVAP